MGHNVGDAAARAVRNSERKATEAKTPEQRISEIRRNLSSVPVLFNTPAEQRFLLEQYDAALQNEQGAAGSFNETIDLLLAENKKLKEENAEALATIERKRELLNQSTAILKTGTEAMEILGAENKKLREENDQFRAVYELENSSRGTVTVIAENPVTGLPVAAVTQVDFIPAQTE